MKITNVLIYSLLCVVLWSCSNASMSEDSSTQMSYEPEGYSEDEMQEIQEQQVDSDIDYKKIAQTQSKEKPESPENNTQTEPQKTTEPEAVERKLIKNGRIGFQTDDLGKTHKSILSTAKKYNAYIASDEEIKRYDQIDHTIIVRIPAKRFDSFLTDISKGIEEFDYKEIQSQDVTAEYLDLQARIKTKKEMEIRYLAILQKANTVTDLLEVERQLGEVRGEIESMQGRLKFLKNQVSFSTLNINFYKDVPYKGDSFFARLGKGFGEGWEGLLSFLVDITYVWPFIILAGLGIWGVRRVWKKKDKSTIIK